MIRGFALKNILIILMIVMMFSSSYFAFINKRIRVEKNMLLLEKQKNTEHVLYSYFMSHLNNNKEEDLVIEQAKIHYQIQKENQLSRLDATICIEGCYKMILEYDHTQKCIVKDEYEAIN